MSGLDLSKLPGMLAAALRDKSKPSPAPEWESYITPRDDGNFWVQRPGYQGCTFSQEYAAMAHAEYIHRNPHIMPAEE